MSGQPLATYQVLCLGPQILGPLLCPLFSPSRVTTSRLSHFVDEPRMGLDWMKSVPCAVGPWACVIMCVYLPTGTTPYLYMLPDPALEELSICF